MYSHQCNFNNNYSGEEQLTSHMSKYCQQLKDEYRTLHISSPKEQLRCKSSDYVDVFLEKIDEKVSEDEYYGSISKPSWLSSSNEKTTPSGSSLCLSDVLNFEEGRKKVILIEGGPGMGKSTLAIKICKSWAIGESFQQYDAIILLPLQDEDTQKAEGISDLLQIKNKEEKKRLSDEIEKSDGNRICFILDGFDELPKHLQNKSSLFVQLPKRLPKCTVVYTSRPEAYVKLEFIVSQKIKIHGFREEEVNKYIESAYKSVDNGEKKAQELMLKVKNNLSIRNILWIPIISAIICHIFLSGTNLPNTLTELYRILCLNLISRHISKQNPDEEEDGFDSFDNLPEPYDKQFHNLCYLAYKEKEQGKISFSKNKLKEIDINVNEKSGLGFLLIVPTIALYGRQTLYGFLHPTLQEFYAAMYISKLSPKEQLEQLNKYQFNDDYQRIWRFYSGITGLENKDILEHMLPSKWVFSDYRKERIVELLLCIHETQYHSKKISRFVGDHMDGAIDLSNYRLYNHRLYNEQNYSYCAIGYFLREYKGVLKEINLANCHIDDEACEILLPALSTALSFRKSDLQINLWYHDLTDKSSDQIVSLVSSNYPINRLDVGGCKIYSSIGSKIVEKLSCNTSIREIVLCQSFLDMELLGKMLSSNKTLSILNISDNNIGANGCGCMAKWRKISLNRMIMKKCKIGNIGMDKVGLMLSYNASVEYIDLEKNKISDSGVQKFVGHLSKCNSIKQLILRKNDITDTGADHIVQLFTCSRSSLTRIALSGNKIKSHGIDRILHSIRKVDTVHIMEGVEVDNVPFSTLSTVLHKTKLISFSVAVGDYQYDEIKDSLATTTILEEIQIYNGSDEANSAICDGISRNNSITRLRFCGGCLNNTLLYLSNIIGYNKTIFSLDIHFVSLSSNASLLLAKALNKNITIKIMKIEPHADHDRFDQNTATSFLKELKDNNALESLTLGMEPEYNSNYKLIREIEKLVSHLNNMRRNRGIAVMMQVLLMGKQKY